MEKNQTNEIILYQPDEALKLATDANIRQIRHTKLFFIMCYYCSFINYEIISKYSKLNDSKYYLSLTVKSNDRLRYK